MIDKLGSKPQSFIFKQGVLIAIILSLFIAISLPLIFKSDFLLSILSQMGIMIIFALSYNMLLGQTGLLSFGHSVYYGLGAFATMHIINMISKSYPIPLALLPLAGGIFSAFVAIFLGYVTTKKAGTTFSMISLGICEMVFASSLMFSSFFGGEGGVSGNRVYGKPGFFGVTYGPQIEFYFLILIWMIICALLMFKLSQTPLGKMANAVRDNPDRTEFIGYNPQRIRFLMVILSGFFAGIAGGLTALNYEIVTAETVSAATSGNVLLMTFVGGIGNFFGPMIGAILITFMQFFIGSISRAWLFYFGLLFILMVLYVPGGVASIINIQMNLLREGLLLKILPYYLLLFIPTLIFCCGLISLVEMTYIFLGNDNSTTEPIWSILGFNISTLSSVPWLIASGMICSGFYLTRIIWVYQIQKKIAADHSFLLESSLK